MRVLLKQGTSFPVDDDRYIAVQLQDAGRCARADAAVNRIVDGLGLVAAAGQQDDLLGQHDRLDAHADGVAGDFRFIFEEAGIGLDGFIVEFDLVRRRLEFDVRLIEADVGVPADAEDLRSMPPFSSMSAS